MTVASALASRRVQAASDRRASGSPPRRARRSLRRRARRRRAAGSRPRGRGRRETSRCTRSGRSSTPARDALPRPATAAGCVPTPRRWRSGRSARGRRRPARRRCRCRESRRTPTSAPAAAPSVASDTARQLASLASRTSRPSARSRSALERPAVQPGRVGVLDEAGRRRDGAGHARCRPCSVAPTARSPRRDESPRWRAIVAVVVVARRRRRARSQTHAARRVEDDGRDLGAAEVDAQGAGRFEGSTDARVRRLVRGLAAFSVEGSPQARNP